MTRLETVDRIDAVYYRLDGIAALLSALAYNERQEGNSGEGIRLLADMCEELSYECLEISEAVSAEL